LASVETLPAGAVEEWPLTALLRGARAVFAAKIRRALSECGYEDLPPNGPYVIGGMARTSAPLADVIRQLGASKQAAGQLVDALVTRGYLDRYVDPGDRRRLVVRLTERGAAAAEVIRAAVDSLEAQMVAAMGTDRVRTTCEVLAWVIRRGPADA
jgi:DNA-binding MarR family transcriptional regulator